MGRHRLEPPPRVRPRYGRVAAAGLSLVVTLVAPLGGLGLLPVQTARGGSDEVPVSSPTHHRLGAGTAQGSRQSSTQPDRADADPPASVAAPQGAVPTGTTLPAGSGEGRRVVFGKSAQRVWLVDPDGTVAATYLVSGSVTDNLRPGTYDVYSRSRWAVGVDRSGVMQYFVRFAYGPTRRSASTASRPSTARRCRARSSWGRRSRTAASGSGSPTPDGCGSSPASAPTSSWWPDPER